MLAEALIRGPIGVYSSRRVKVRLWSLKLISREYEVMMTLTQITLSMLR